MLYNRSYPTQAQFSILRIGEISMQYQKYLKSEKWKQKRNTILKKAGYRCRRCGTRATEVHHENYKRIYNEKLSDLTALCRTCHQKAHTRKPIQKRKQRGYSSKSRRKQGGKNYNRYTRKRKGNSSKSRWKQGGKPYYRRTRKQRGKS